MRRTKIITIDLKVPEETLLAALAGSIQGYLNMTVLSIENKPTSVADEELGIRRKVIEFVSGLQMGVLRHQTTTDGLLDLITSSNKQLLKELLEQTVEVNTVQYHYSDGSTVVNGFTNNAVPVGIIQAKLKAMEKL
jgi:hypothetical protein